METDHTIRPRPDIVFVPPPDGPGIPRQRVIGIITWCGFVFLVVLVVSTALGGFPTALWASLLVTFGLVALVVSVVSRRMTRAQQVARQMFLERRPEVRDDPTAATLAKAWKVPDRVPKVGDVQAALREVRAESANDRARIICYGEPEVPEVGALRFEPEIITPTGAVWRELFWIVIAGVLLGLFVLDYVRLLPAWFPSMRNFIGLAYFLVAGAVALGLWVWKGLIRPTYVRMAPGIIQVLEFRSSRSKPTIRSYPIEPGTLVVLTRIRKRLTLVLARGDQKTSLQLSRMQNPERRIERTWQALLSTAPTPPLSDEDLLG